MARKQNKPRVFASSFRAIPKLDQPTSVNLGVPAEPSPRMMDTQSICKHSVSGCVFVGELLRVDGRWQPPPPQRPAYWPQSQGSPAAPLVTRRQIAFDPENARNRGAENSEQLRERSSKSRLARAVKAKALYWHDWHLPHATATCEVLSRSNKSTG